jgi:hypothetical protein
LPPPVAGGRARSPGRVKGCVVTNST